MCQYKRMVEKTAMKRVVEVMESKKAEKEREAERKRVERRKKKEEHERVVEEERKRSRGWRFW